MATKENAARKGIDIQARKELLTKISLNSSPTATGAGAGAGNLAGTGNLPLGASTQPQETWITGALVSDQAFMAGAAS